MVSHEIWKQNDRAKPPKNWLKCKSEFRNLQMNLTRQSNSKVSKHKNKCEDHSGRWWFVSVESFWNTDNIRVEPVQIEKFKGKKIGSEFDLRRLNSNSSDQIYMLESTSLPYRSNTALRHWEVADCSQVADTVDTRTYPEKTTHIDGLRYSPDDPH